MLKYHVIANTLLYPDHVFDGMLKSTLLGADYQIQFHINNNQVIIISSWKASQPCDRPPSILLDIFSIQGIASLLVLAHHIYDVDMVIFLFTKGEFMVAQW